MTSITEKISALPPLRQLINQKDFQARKSLSQNFIFDLNLTQRIARVASPLTGTVFEIGPGPGHNGWPWLIHLIEKLLSY